MSVKSVLTALADAVRNKSGLTGAMTLEQMTEAVLGIQQGIDTSDATAVASDVAKGATAYVNGEKVTGTLEESYPSSNAGTVSYSTSEVAGINIRSIFIKGEAKGDVICRKGQSYSLSASASDFGNATAEDVVAGKTFTSLNGLKVTGTYEGSGGFQVALGTFTPAETKSLNSVPPVQIEHNAGFTPDAFIFYKASTGTYGLIAISAKGDILWGNGSTYYDCYVMCKGSSTMGEGALMQYPATENVTYIRSSVTSHKVTAGQEYRWIAIGGIL